MIADAYGQPLGPQARPDMDRREWEKPPFAKRQVDYRQAHGTHCCGDCGMFKRDRLPIRLLRPSVTGRCVRSDGRTFVLGVISDMMICNEWVAR